MLRNWTFGQRLGAALVAILALTLSIGIFGAYTMRRVLADKDRVIDVNAQMLVHAQGLRAAALARTAAVRGYLLFQEESFLQERDQARTTFVTRLDALKQLASTAESRRMLDDIERADAEVLAASDRATSLRQSPSTSEAALRVAEQEELPKRQVFERQIASFAMREEEILAASKQASTDAADSATAWLVAILAVGGLAAAIAAFALVRSLTRQIGAAVGLIQSSSSELQATATQQATGSKEQAIAMAQISATMSELLATSRQISENAQQVARIAEQTANAARLGDATVDAANESIAGIQRHVDAIVNHMLELGRKSQQIGAVLDIVSELSEQTNILAINATIEAVGAGESGRRFAVVAEEIRKLADRVGGSTKEIRGLIDDVRSAVNTTVMATETGSKAVDAGSKQFSQVTVAFKQIADVVVTATDAAREIELSTKQQMTAVEQVNAAIANVAQASKEAETSSGQTQQTASELAVLSKDLLRLVRPQVAA